MGKKVVLGTLVGFVAAMLYGMLVWGFLLAAMMEDFITNSGACVQDPSMLYIILGTLAYALLLAWALYKMGSMTAKSGAITGLILTVLIYLHTLIWSIGMYTFYSTDTLLPDSIATIVQGTLCGAAVGWIMGRIK